MTVLVFTSCLFLTNVLHNAYRKDYFYSWILLLLWTTSVFMHSHCFIDDDGGENMVSYEEDELLYLQITVLDKFAILLVVAYGTRLFIRGFGRFSFFHFIPILTFLSVVYLYIGGYFMNMYCFDKEQDMADKYHGLLHTLSSVGHHCIIAIQ